MLSALVSEGYPVLLPFGDNQRYDMVVEVGGLFVTVQCKTGRLRDGAVLFRTCSSTAHRGGGQESYRGQVDVFGVYCHELRAVYFIRVEDVGASSCALRVVPATNSQVRHVRHAGDYVFPLNPFPAQ